MNPNAKQVGGDHYAGTYQHWDFVINNGLDYLTGCATKYISRHRKKHGPVDLEKAKHYVEKIASVEGLFYHQSPPSDVIRFCHANQLGPLEEQCLMLLCGKEVRNKAILEGVLLTLDQLIAEYRTDAS